MRILIAEDAPKLLKSLVRIFELDHYAVDGVNNGHDAFDYASSGEYIADEPTGNLDTETQDEIMEIFRSLADQGKCVIIVSHSPAVAEMCDERYELIKISGKKQKRGAKQES